MKIEFIATGGALDAVRGTTCILVDSETKLLVDCGHSAPAKLMPRYPDINFIDAVYFSHAHADHMMGIVGLMCAWSYRKRAKPLTVIGQPGTKERFQAYVNLGYPALLGRNVFPVEYIETTQPITFRELSLSFAETDHPLRNYAIRIESQGTVVCVSGDGALTESSRKLFRDSHLLIHEAWMADETIAGHTSALEVSKFADTLPNLQTLALVHADDTYRNADPESYLKHGAGKRFELRMPEPGEAWTRR